MTTATRDLWAEFSELMGDMLVREEPAPPVQADSTACWTQYQPNIIDTLKEEWKSLTWHEQLELFAYINRKAD